MSDSPAAPRVACPQCRAPAPPRSENPAWPFCSERCKLIDLGAWIDEDYRIPVGADATERTGPPSPDEPLD